LVGGNVGRWQRLVKYIMVKSALMIID
jgi:hypothetical protein